MANRGRGQFMPFVTELDARALPDGRNWQLLADLTFNYSRDDDEESDSLTATSRAGSVTDFASIPRVLWIMWPPDGKYRRAATIHDHMYRMGTFPRAIADTIFLEAMDEDGVSKFSRSCIYLGVRLGGAWSYKDRHPVNRTKVVAA